jgi:hypothetical protein
LFVQEDAINAIFCSRFSFLIAISRFEADDLSAQSSTYTTATGPRVRVYFAAVPSLWAAIRFDKSLVMPQYSVSSAQRRI